MRSFIVLLLCLVLSACASMGSRGGQRPGGMHVVRSGETLAKIAQQYQVSPQLIAEWNNIESATAELKEGRRIYVPAGKRTKVSAKSVQRWERGGSVVKTYRGAFIWPVDGPVNSLFGMRDGHRHDGVDLGGKIGDPVRAAAAGTVVFEGKMSGYGNLIIVRHSNGYYTAYAHNSAHEVKKGDQVKQGKVIAKLGATGRATGPHLHFEVRDKQAARNPLFFLPPRNATERAVYAKGRGSGAPALVAQEAPARTAPDRVAATRSPAATKKTQAPARAARAAEPPAATNTPWKKFVPKDASKKAVRIHQPYRAKVLKGQ